MFAAIKLLKDDPLKITLSIAWKLIEVILGLALCVVGAFFAFVLFIIANMFV